MFWLDLGIFCLLLWGGVAGYIAGWKHTLRHLGALFVTAVAAAAVKGDMKVFLALHYPIAEAMKALAGNRLAIPVDGSAVACQAVLAELGLPRAVQVPVLRSLNSLAAPDFNHLVDLLAQVMYNAFSFLVVLILWWSFFHLAAALWPIRRGAPLKRSEQWGGFLSGLLRQSLLLILAIGVLAPFTWLLPLPRELFDFEAAALARLGMHIFYYSGLWWN